MKNLKAFITKKNLSKVSVSKDSGKYYGKYLNSDYIYICIPRAIDIVEYFENYIGDEADDDCSLSYWILYFETLRDTIRAINLSYDDELYVYVIEKRICMRYKIEELTNLIEDWDHNESELCGWPRIDIDELLKLK